MTPAQVTTKSLQQLKDFLAKKGPTCVHKPEGQLKYTYVTPSFAVVPGSDDNAEVPGRSATGHYLQMYDWDACFFSQVAHKIGVNDLPKAVIANFLSMKDSDGYVPRTISPGQIWDAGDMCKPFLCQTLVLTGADSAASEFVQDLDCYLGYYQRKRKNETGLYHWRNVLESGVDDNYALLAPREAAVSEGEVVVRYPDGELLATDLSSYLYAEYVAFATIAEKSGNKELSAQYQKLAKETASAIEELLWNEALAIYCNRYPNSSEQVRMRAWTGLAPVLFGVSSPERAEQVVRKTIMNEEHFLRPFGITSLAASELLYNNSKRGLYGRALVSNWQGPAWVLPNALTVRALLKYGFAKEAKQVASRIINTVTLQLEKTGTMYENYDAENGAPLWAPDFMSWNSLLLESIELLES